MRLLINPRYAHLEGFVRGLHRNFESMPYERILRNIRNDVREVSVAGEHLVVKSFRRLSLVNRVAYGRLRASKSMRALATLSNSQCSVLARPSQLLRLISRSGDYLRGVISYRHTPTIARWRRFVAAM